MRGALYSAILCSLLSALLACSPEEPTQPTAAPGAGSTGNGAAAPTSAEVAAAPDACQAGQAMIETGYQNFPGKQCAEIASLVEATYTTKIGYRRQCQQLTGAASRPEAVARVQVNECGPLRGEEGHYASMRVCCAVPDVAATPKTISYEVILRCPDDRVRALATDLHYP
ncbi:MAG: hypothetical protein HKN19_13360, partial [Halioglobus sp.]|nr:hypothetical protein [Halioglobus sp.]